MFQLTQEEYQLLRSQFGTLARKLSDLERKLGDHDERIQTIFEVIHQLMAPPDTKKKKIGFTIKERQARYGNKPKRKKR